jgi:hypothetical protein
MRQITHHSRRISQFLIVGLLSCWVALTIGLLSYWLVMLRLIKSILKRKGKNETIERVKPSLVTDTGNSSGLSPEAEPEIHPVATQAEPETLPVATQAEPEIHPVATQPEPEIHPVATQPEPETLPVTTQPEPETLPVATQPEPETLPVATQPEVESSISSTDAIEAYCVKCRQRRMIQGAKKVTTQKGRHAMEGICPICGTKLFRFIAREKETLP